MVEASRAQGLEGVIAKRLDSVYEPGRRSGAWLKIKHRRRARLVVGGWMPGEGGRRGSIGSLLAGYYEPGSTRLRYAGRVGSGLTDSDLRRLSSLLEPLRRRLRISTRSRRRPKIRRRATPLQPLARSFGGVGKHSPGEPAHHPGVTSPQGL